VNRQALAERIAGVIEREDRASRFLGMRLDEVKPGAARMSMRVTADMVNGQGVCHGGLIFSLADSSFGYACNTHNQRALAASCSIDFLAPAQLGDELTAQATEVARTGRTGVYDVRVTNQQGELVALFRGKAATVKGSWINSGTEPAHSPCAIRAPSPNSDA
jgi:acyl-CoA thioesterase